MSDKLMTDGRFIKLGNIKPKDDTTIIFQLRSSVENYKRTIDDNTKELTSLFNKLKEKDITIEELETKIKRLEIIEAKYDKIKNIIN